MTSQPLGAAPKRASGIPPWHMWGSQGSATLISTGAPSDNAKTVQLARVHYKRPETWTFLFFVTVINAPGAVAGPWDFRVQFELTVGVGRGVIALPMAPFVFSSANMALLDLNGIPQRRFCTSLQLPPLDDSANPLLPNNGPGVFDRFPAQDIQCGARYFYTGGPAVNSVTAEAGSFFSPRTHIRPEWFKHPPELEHEDGGK